MNIALIGYGKMGKAIEEIASERRHAIVLTIDESNHAELNQKKLQKADVAIEFTGPHAAYENIIKLLDYGIPVVSGSTGWLDKLEDVKKHCAKKKGAFIYASNFSIGVNIFFELNKKLAALMHPHKQYEVALEEVHHTQKKDAPSGTAITLAEDILDCYKEKKKWVNDVSPAGNELLITSKRIDPAPGTHTIQYSSDIDDISITHTAHNRKGFALGAVIAAEFLQNKTGVYSMREVLGM